MSLARTLAGVVGVTVAAAAFAVPAQAATTPQAAPAPPDVHTTIIDGQPADSAPWGARMFTDGKQLCSATIVAPEWVLTAQHCAAEGGHITFHIGNIDQTKGQQAAAKPGGIHIHPQADLALIQLDHPVKTQYSPLGQPGDVQVGDTVQTYGWGATCTDKPEIQCQSRVLKYANVRVTDIDCSDYRGGKAVCGVRGDGIPAGGDSGGPMFAKNAQGQQVQVGVASTSDRQRNTAYGSTMAYRDWIKSIAGV